LAAIFEAGSLELADLLAVCAKATAHINTRTNEMERFMECFLLLSLTAL
jgi:hypothetical protein